MPHPYLADLPAFAATDARVWASPAFKAASSWATGDPEAPLDLAVLAGVLREAPRPTALLDEAMARLKPGGVLLIIEPMRAAAPLAATRHVDALDLDAALDRARGGWRAPVFQRLQVGSLIQGYGLTQLGFSAVFPDYPAPAETFLATFAAARDDAGLSAGLRAEAERLYATIAEEGLGMTPVIRDWGTKT